MRENAQFFFTIPRLTMKKKNNDYCHLTLQETGM